MLAGIGCEVSVNPRSRFRIPVSVFLAVGFLSSSCMKPFVTAPGSLDPARCETSSSVTQSAYLIGDAGAPLLPDQDGGGLADPVLRALASEVDRSAATLGAEQVAVILLGDNVYYRGLTPPGHPDRRRGERILEAQIAAAGDARSIFVAGNHDWDVEGADGWDHVRAQDDFLHQQGPRVSMLPPGGCAGPSRMDMGRWLRFVFIDPLGYSHVSRYPDEHDDVCPYNDVQEGFRALASEFRHPSDRHVVLALHHPLITAGPHGGHYTLKQHIFPLTDFWSWAWLPLPVIGSIYPVARQLGVTTTDLSNEQYVGYRTGIYRATTPWAPLLVAAGHEHSLQVHHDWVGLYYAVSGAGSRKKPDRVEPQQTLMRVQPGSDERAAWARPGFMRLDAHDNGALDLAVLALGDEGESVELFRHCLADGPPEERPRR
jgi:hypothetical protein